MTRRRLRGGNTFVLDPQVYCKCGNIAVHWFEIHAVDLCTPERRTLGSLLCAECLKRDIKRAEEIVADGAEWCSSCGLTLVSLSDIIVRHCPLEER